MGTQEKLLLRKDLPYGVREFANGSVELFNRDYETISQKGPDPEGDIVGQSFYYTDRNPPWRDLKTKDRCMSVLKEWNEA